MKKQILRTAIIATLASAAVLPLTGCIGSNAITAKVMKFNVEVVDNRYARAGVNLLLSPVYAFTVAVDYVVFNSIEFWAGKNPINGSPHIFDTKTKTMMEINKDLDPSLTDAPLSQADVKEKQVHTAQVVEIDADTLDFNITYTNGEKVTLRGKKEGQDIFFYLEGELVTVTSMEDLAAYNAS